MNHVFGPIVPGAADVWPSSRKIFRMSRFARPVLLEGRGVVQVRMRRYPLAGDCKVIRASSRNLSQIESPRGRVQRVVFGIE